MPSAVSLAGFLGSDERHEEQPDDYLDDDPTDDANPTARNVLW